MANNSDFTGPTEKERAAQAAAVFSAFMIRECFSAESCDPDLQSRLQQGLLKTGSMQDAWDLTGRLSKMENAGPATLDTAYMMYKFPEACIELGEIFANALTSSYGSVRQALEHGFLIQKDKQTSDALSRNNALTLSQFFKPVYN